MIPEKTNISARVEITLKKIVEESSFTHKDAYELGAMLMAIGDAQGTYNTNTQQSQLWKDYETKGIPVNWKEKTGTWKRINGFIGEPSLWVE